MSASVAAETDEPLFILPGFYPDAVGFAIRTTIALLLAYFVAFWMQLDAASTVGVCVAIVAQPSPGMALSKAIYRIAGTLLGGVAAVVFTGLFAQDRTMLLVAFTLWLGLCTFVAALLRDFRSYGAVLCGYTVGLIAIDSIDAPGAVFVLAMNRVAAILLGVVAVAIVNSVLARNAAYETLAADLGAQVDEMTALALDTLAGREVLDDAACVRRGTAILALETQASYAANELADGHVRSAGARSAIAALLGMLSASRSLSFVLPVAAVEPATRAVLDDAAAAIRDPAVTMPPMPAWSTARQAFLQERAVDLQAQHALARDGLRTLTGELPGGRRVRLGVHYDATGAALNALRTVIAVALGSIFCILAGWSDSVLLLEIQAAFTALFAMQPNPSSAVVGYILPLPLAALVVGVVGFLLLPLVSGFLLFGLTVAPVVFLASLAIRHPRTLRYGPAFLWYFVLLLAPANNQSFDIGGFINSVALLAVSLLFILWAFQLILPVSPRRRLARLANAIVKDLRRTLVRGRILEQATAQSLQYDRLTQVKLWLGRPTPARQAVLHRLFAFAEFETVLDQAWTALDAALGMAPGLAEPVATARTSLIQADPAMMVTAAHALLEHAHASRAREAVLRAVSALFGAQDLLTRQARALRLYGVLRS